MNKHEATFNNDNSLHTEVDFAARQALDIAMAPHVSPCVQGLLGREDVRAGLRRWYDVVDEVCDRAAGLGAKVFTFNAAVTDDGIFIDGATAHYTGDLPDFTRAEASLGEPTRHHAMIMACSLEDLADTGVVPPASLVSSAWSGPRRSPTNSLPLNPDAYGIQPDVAGGSEVIYSGADILSYCGRTAANFSGVREQMGFDSDLNPV